MHPHRHGGAQAVAGVVATNSEHGVTWAHSYVSDDSTKTYCVYDGPSPEAIRRVAQRNGLPVDAITEVRVLDPSLLPSGGERCVVGSSRAASPSRRRSRPPQRRAPPAIGRRETTCGSGQCAARRRRTATSTLRRRPATGSCSAHGIACIEMPGRGGMGVHYVRGDLVGDDVLEPTTPEALVYEPDDDGRMRLVAVEYVVFRSAWDATHDTPPSLFGRAFDVTAEGNRFGLPAYYSLPASVWKHNPAGTFAMWNPKVQCAAGECPDVDHHHA